MADLGSQHWNPVSTPAVKITVAQNQKQQLLVPLDCAVYSVCFAACL